MADPYAILGIVHGAPADQVRAAYRRLAAEFHPDRNAGNPSAARRFREVSEAYTRITSGSSSARTPVQVEEISPIFAMGDIVGGFVDILFGTGQSPNRTSVCRARLELDRRSALLGAKREIQVSWDAPCVSCAGVGGEPAGPCGTCGGSGRTGASLGLVRVVATCRTCMGSGRGTRPCRECVGVGAAPRRESIEVEIPPGVRDGARLVYRSVGLADVLGRPVELWIDLTVAP
jgi:molecular chaperone DnaJ